MADLNKVRKTLQQFVTDVKRTEGNKKQIDTQKEYDMLAAKLAGGGLNNDETEYIQGFMIEYQTSQARKFTENEVTDYTKKEVAKIAKRQNGKKFIDTDEEAQALALLLKNTRGDLNDSDIAYIKALLTVSGYGEYIPKNETEYTTSPNVEKETVTEIKTEKTTEETKDSEKTVNKSFEKGTANSTPIKRAPKRSKKVFPKKQEDRKMIPPKSEPDNSKETKHRKYVVAEVDRQKGAGAADMIKDELDKHIANNKKIVNGLQQVNEKNAFSFFGKFGATANRGVNNAVFSVSDKFNKITYKHMIPVIEALLKQAKNLGVGLEKSAEYKVLKSEIDFAKRSTVEKPNMDPSKVTKERVDAYVYKLYHQMKQYIE